MAVNCEALRNADAGDNPYCKEHPPGYTEVREIDGLLHVPKTEYRNSVDTAPNKRGPFVCSTLCGIPMTLDRRNRKPAYAVPTCPECKRIKRHLVDFGYAPAD